MPLTPSDFTAFVGFGDSTVDSGNAAALTLGFATPPNEGYYLGRFSSGPNYFDRLFAAITGEDFEDFEPNNALFGYDAALGGNYAIGGARTDDLSAQLASFASDLAGDAVLDAARIEDTLFGINIGGNDLLSFAAADGLPYTAAGLANLSSEVAGDVGLTIEGLTALGARSVLLSGVPNVGVTPDVANGAFGGDIGDAMAANAPVSAAVNGAMLDAVADLIVADPELTVYWFVPDIGPVLDDPGAFGLDPALILTPFVDDLAAGRTALEDVDRYAFLDDLHVTAPLQRFLFDLALDAEVLGGPDAATENVVDGTLLADRIDAYAGDDVIDGLAGADTLIGGAGADLVLGGAGADLIFGDGGPA